ncbi:MAG: hypothetical protein LC713_05305 [Actinobacteria bacterium]|nr:hypothetical protein [Actinomycetota bacterium]
MPTVPGGAAATAGAAAADAQAPDGHRLVVAGLRPPRLGGYGANPVADDLRARLAAILAAKRQLFPDLVVLSGLGLGAEQLGAEAADATGVPYVAVLAFPGQEGMWPAETKSHYRKLLGGAAGQVELQRQPPATKQSAGAALARRDAWLARHASEAVVLWDGQDASVGRLVRSLQHHLGEEEVWILEPQPQP